jgi:hypothetical protein
MGETRREALERLQARGRGAESARPRYLVKERSALKARKKGGSS